MIIANNVLNINFFSNTQPEIQSLINTLVTMNYNQSWLRLYDLLNEKIEHYEGL